MQEVFEEPIGQLLLRNNRAQLIVFDPNIATELEAGGIPKEHIVLAFRSPEIRKYTGYAVA